MINKQGLWFLTLFSLVLVLSVYYITMPNEVFTSVIGNDNGVNEKETAEVNSEITESNYIATLKIELEEKRSETLKELEGIMSNSDSTSSEKNNAYDKIKNINSTKALEETLVNKIKSDCKLDSFVEIVNNEVKVVIESSEHDVKLANKIMNLVQKEFDEYMIVSVKFS